MALCGKAFKDNGEYISSGGPTVTVFGIGTSLGDKIEEGPQTLQAL